MRVALEIQHRIDDMLQHAWAGQRTIFGDMANEQQGNPLLFGETGQLGGAFADLGYRAWRRCERFRPEGLN